MLSFSLPYTIRSHYTVSMGALHVYYDDERKFGATLDILTDPRLENDPEKNNFVSLVFSYHNKSSKNPETVLFSIMKKDKDTLIYRLTNNKDKFSNFKISGTAVSMSEISKLTESTCNLRAESDKYCSDENLIAQSKKLLENFTTLSKKTLGSTEKDAETQSFDLICNLLKTEISEFSNIIDLNTGNSCSFNK